MADNDRQHTAHFLVSRFLNSKDSLELPINPTDCYVLRYLADLMDMTNSSTGISQCKIPLAQAITFTRLSRSSIQRSISKLLKYNLLTDLNRINGSHGIYTLGASFEICVTQTHIKPVDKSKMRHTDALYASELQKDASHRHTSNKASNNLTKKEQTPLATPSVFVPDEESKQIAQDLKVDLAKELFSFKMKHTGRKTQFEFQCWLQKAHDFALKRNDKVIVESKSTVHFWGPGHPSWETMNGK